MLWIVLSSGGCMSQGVTISPVSREPGASPSPYSASPTTPPLSDDWPSRWLIGVPCRPPCWEGITPGQTTSVEAADILQLSPVITAVEITTVPLFPETGLVQWKWRSTGENGGGALFHSQIPSSPIYLIDPDLPTSFGFGDVIRAYGEPTHIIARARHGPDIGSGISYDLTLVYLSYGFLLDAGGGSDKPLLGEGTRLRDVVFFEPGEEGFEAAFQWASVYPEWLVPWQGMRDFDFYCRDEEGKPCP